MLKIAFDARTLFTSRTGIARYLDGYLKALSRHYQDNEYYLLVPKKNFYSSYNNLKVIASSYNLPEEIWEHFVLEVICRRHTVDVLHSPNEGGPVSSKFFKWIVTIHDLIPLKFPDLYFRNVVHEAYYYLKLKNVRNHADKILTVSKATADDIIKFLGIPASKIEVIHTPPDEIFNQVSSQKLNEVLDKYHIRQPYLLAIGSMEPRKNLRNILLAYKKLLSERVDIPSLILFGYEWRNTSSLSLIREVGLVKNVIYVGGVLEQDLPALYSGALAFIYPSFYEGYGLPVIEAMACGCPVITSNVSSLPEVAQDAAILVNPLNYEEIKNAILALLIDASLTKSLVNKGFERVRQLSWQKAADKLMEVYNEAK